MRREHNNFSTKQIVIEDVTVEELVLLITETIKQQLPDFSQKERPTKELPELITREKLAEILSVSMPTIHNWMKAGILTPYKMGNRTYFKRSEVLGYIYSTNSKKVA